MITEAEKARKRRYRLAHKEQIAAYDAARYVTHKDEMDARRDAYRAANKEKVTARVKVYTTTHRAERALRMAEYRARNPEKEAARRKVKIEVRAFRFPPANTMVCDICGEALAHHWHHHNGYSPEHALDVIAVCRLCHIAAHKKEYVR